MGAVVFRLVDGRLCHEQRVPSVVRTCPAWAVPSLIDILDASNLSSSAARTIMSPSPLFSSTFVSVGAATGFVYEVPLVKTFLDM
jgi:hypothetical protein